MFKIFKIFVITVVFSLSCYSISFSNSEKIKIGLLVPMTGEHKNLGHLVIKSIKLALEDIGTDNIEIYPKNTDSDPNKTLQSAKELKNKGVKMTKEGAMAKYFSSEVGVKIATDAVQVLGGYGYTKDFPVERYYRDSKLCTIGEGTSEIQKLVIAKQIIA